jgi:hypothetical protein
MATPMSNNATMVGASMLASINIAPIGFAIWASIQKSAPDLPLFRCHKIAAQILADLSAAGSLGSNQQTNK